MQNLGTRTLTTERLCLRKFTLDDADAMFEGWASHPEVTKNVGWKPHKNRQETYDILASWIKEYDDNYYNWAVECLDTHELIGNISVISLSEPHQNAEIGYFYGSKYWNRGYATEALKAVIKYLLEECGLHLVEAKHYSTNPASGRVMQKAGMIQEAVLKDRRYHAETDSFCDLVYYSKIR